MRDEENASRRAGTGGEGCVPGRRKSWAEAGGEKEWGLFGSVQRVQHGQGREVQDGSWKRKLKRLVGAELGGWVSHAEEPTLCPGQEPWEDKRRVPMDGLILTPFYTT